MKIKEFVIIPSSIDAMGLIHKPGVGPNNRFGFKNVGNTRGNEARGTCWHGYQQKGYKKQGNKMVPNCVKEEAAGVGIVTKQNATKDVPKGGEYMNVKKLKLDWEEFKENFADKKVKGKSRPGRVKRSGASCKGSVTSLRAKAKKYGGERGKMYHWCANMKSGRKKK